MSQPGPPSQEVQGLFWDQERRKDEGFGPFEKMGENENKTHLECLVVGSLMTMTSETSPNLEKYSFNPSSVVCHERPPTNIFLEIGSWSLSIQADE